MLKPFATICLLSLALGLPEASGKRNKAKQETAPLPTAAPAEAIDSSQDAQPTPEPAPPLFPEGLPVNLSSLPAGLASLSAQSCNACHFETHDLWAATGHATGHLSETYQKALAELGHPTACQSCHLPLMSQHRQLTVGHKGGDLSRPEQLPNEAWNAGLEMEGVTCAACHIRDGVVVGTHANDGPPHVVRASEELTQPEFCATCHQASVDTVFEDADGNPKGLALYDTYGEWKASPYAAAGVGCVDCHGGAGTLGGPTNPHAIGIDTARALTITIDLSESVVQRGKALLYEVTLQNTGAGHAFPTGSPFKVVRLEAALLNAKGEPLDKPHVRPLGRTISEGVRPRITADHRLLPGESMKLKGRFNVSQKARAGQARFQVRILQEGRGQPLVDQAMNITLN